VRPAARHLAPRRRPGWRRTRRPGRSAARRTGRARSHPRRPAPAQGISTVQGRSSAGRHAAFRRFPRRPCPSLGRKTRALRVPHESRDRRGLLRPPRTSAARVDGIPARLAPRQPGPPGLARPARPPPEPRAAPRPGLARPGRRDLVLRGRVRPVLADQARLARARHGPARGRATIRSARPRRAWARRPRRGPRVLFPASRAVPGNRRAARPVPVLQAARVPAAGGPGARSGPAPPTAGRVRAGSRVRVLVVPGPAR